MGWFRGARHNQVVGEGIGPGGVGIGTITPNRPFSTRGSDLHDGIDQYASRPAARPLLGYVGLQLRNGRADISSTGRVLAVNQAFFRNQARPITRMTLPGDRLRVPPSPSQVQSWTAAGAGQIPTSVAGNGAVITPSGTVYSFGSGAY